ncbi:hypothetical protein M422DRAFT_37275 [Sphaerobolus stellatus SS14]|uniref:Uncharacterized protein n=1 Tax=Sphaerobolus stellatus (strain SS14) TaxID=990650 RepID=A0A0C9UTM1_SPHS4|nr:hypothetical protein M422DRAFT_37275 [Sphaerobolus stellatus SS14]
MLVGDVVTLLRVAGSLCRLLPSHTIAHRWPVCSSRASATPSSSLSTQYSSLSRCCFQTTYVYRMCHELNASVADRYCGWWLDNYSSCRYRYHLRVLDRVAIAALNDIRPSSPAAASSIAKIHSLLHPASTLDSGILSRDTVVVAVLFVARAR